MLLLDLAFKQTGNLPVLAHFRIAGFSDQFLTDDAEESAKEAFYREGLKLPRTYMAKLFRWAAFGDWWDAYALVKVPSTSENRARDPRGRSGLFLRRL